MTIKLIQPKMTKRPMDSALKSAISPSLALLTLAALTPKEHVLYIQDENTQKLNLTDTPDIVGITVNLDTSQRAYRIASAYRRKGIPVVAGGIHVSAVPDEAAHHFDSLCIGEAEDVWPDILSDAEKGCLKKRYRSILYDMERVPIPLWDKIDSRRYLYTNTITTGRGCPHTCEFCYNSCTYVLRGTRNRPYEHVLEEIKSLNSRHIMFIDDNFIGNIDWTRGFLQQIKPLKLIWNAAVSTDIVHHLDLLDLMQESGCKSLFIGFETLSQDSILSVKKKQNNIMEYEKLIREIHARGIMLNASLVFGFDDDGPQVFKNTLRWLVKNKVETMTAHILTPYPGTVLYKRLLAEGRITDFNHEHYNTAHVVFRPRHMTEKELYKGYLWMYKKFYSFKNIIRRLPDNRDQRIPYLLFGLVYRKFGRFTSLIAKMGFMNKLGKWARKLSYNI